MSRIASLVSKAFALADKKKNAGLSTPDEIVRFDDISYGPDPVWNLLDVYRPREAQGKLPVIIDVHGGGWVYGDKYVYQYYCMSLAQRGFAVVNFSYRLAPEHVFPASIGGAVITETVFSWPGVGRLIIDYVHQRDVPVVTGAIIMTTIITGVIHLAVDLLYAVVDPRIKGKYSRKGVRRVKVRKEAA